MRDLIFFLRLFKPYWRWLLAGMALALLTALATITLLGLSGWFITASAIAGSVAADGVAMAFNFMQPAAEIRALAIIRTLGRYGERLITHEATFRVLAQIRHWLFARLLPIAPGGLAWQRSGDLLSHITADIDALDALYLRILAPLIVGFVAATMVSVWLASFAPALSLLNVLLLIVAVVVVPYCFSRLSQTPSAQALAQSAALKTLQIEMLQGLAELLSFKAYSRFQQRLLKASAQLVDSQARLNRLFALSSAITLFVSQLVLLAAIVYLAEMYRQQQIGAALLAGLVFTVWATLEAAMPVSGALHSFAKTRQAARRIRAAAELSPAIVESAHPVTLPEACDLQIDGLSFRYPNQPEWLLENINLTIPHGSKIAIVGDSGAGKTSLLHLLLRFFDPQQGGIYLGGVDFRQLASDERFSRFALLSQHSRLFAASIAENLRLAKADATDAELLTALKTAGLDDLLRRLPDGLQTWVGEKGLKLSGGEVRRLALARVYLQNAPIILLDEPTEGLDADTERQVLASLEAISAQKTVLLVTHRQAGLQQVDAVYRIESGQLFLDNHQ